MEKRLLLATFLSLAVLILFQYLYGQKSPSKYAFPPEKTLDKPVKSVVVKKAIKSHIKELDKKGSDYIFDTRVTRVVLTDLGGRIKAIYLKEYTNDEDQPVNLIDTDNLEDFYPVSLQFGDMDLTSRANNSLYKAQYDALTTSKRRSEARITFKYTDQDGIKYTKSYIFYHDNYIIKAKFSMENLPHSQINKAYKVIFGGGLGDSKNKNSRYSYQGPAVYIDNKVIRDGSEDLLEPIRHYGKIPWIALESKYFAIALISPETVSTAIVDKADNRQLAIGLEYIITDSVIEKEMKIYAGPKDSKKLGNANPDLKRLVDFGWFSFLAIPLLNLLNYSYRFTHNYGLSIIVMTVLIKIIFYPLSHKSYKSMQKMQELQPKIKLIQERYKKDREKLNQEMMALYRQDKVNPLGGCLPMLLQIPVFFALYRVLLGAIELRKAPFFWWIKDLSAKDPYYFWPILMGLSMFFQQKMTPPVGDPRQHKIMMMMPLIFTVMFLNFPVGLVLYWLVNNVLTIMQQYYTTRKKSGKPSHA